MIDLSTILVRRSLLSKYEIDEFSALIEGVNLVRRSLLSKYEIDELIDEQKNKENTSVS